MMKFVLNAFSLNMVSFPCTVKVHEVSPIEAAALAGHAVPSGVGHADTAAVFSSVLGVNIPMNRTTVTLVSGDTVLVGQYSGPRLPEGATTLPEGATLKWLVVTVS